MRNTCVGAAFAVLAIAGSAFATITPTDVASRGALGIGTTLNPLDVTSTRNFFGGTNGNEFTTDFQGLGNNFSGTIKLELFGNAAAGTSSLTDVLLVYTFTGDLNTNGVEAVEFGVNSVTEINGPALAAATQGRITGEGTTTQASPVVDVNQPVVGNDTWDFRFGTLSPSTGDLLGGPAATETVVWYVRLGGDIDIQLVEAQVTDFGGVDVLVPAVIKSDGQDNLNIPAPGAAALLGLAGIAARRRRG